MKKKIHLWIPNMFQFKGGIQIYCTFLLEAIQQVYPSATYDVFLKHDTNCSPNVNFLPKTQFHYGGNIPAQLRTFYFAWLLLVNSLQQKPDLIICGHANFSPLAAKISKLLNIPYWVIVHGVDVWNLTDLSKINGLKSADKIISVSQYTANCLVQEQNISPGQISLLPNTFDETKFNIAPKPKYLLEKYKLNPDQAIILTIARLAGEESYKGYDKVIQTLPEIIKTIPNVHYLIGGKGGDRPRIEKLIQDLNLEKYVTLAGFIPDEQLADHYNLCDVFAMPSKGEGFGIVYLEAMACGKPCLGGNQDGAIDALCNGELGALVNPDNIDEIVATLILILQGNYSNLLIYDPEALREKVINAFGFKEFEKKIYELMNYPTASSGVSESK